MTDSLPKFDYNALQQSVLQSPDPIQTPASIATPQSDDIYYDELKNRTRILTYKIVPSTSSCYVGNVVGGNWRVPFSGNLPQMWAYVETAGTTGTMTIDVRWVSSAGTVTINTMSVATTAPGSPIYTAATGPKFSRNDSFHFNIPAVHTTPAIGLTIVLVFADTSKGLTGSLAALT